MSSAASVRTATGSIICGGLALEDGITVGSTARLLLFADAVSSVTVHKLHMFISILKTSTYGQTFRNCILHKPEA